MQAKLDNPQSDTDETRQTLQSLRAQLDRACAELLRQRALTSGYQAQIADLNAQISQWRQQSTQWEARTHALEKLRTELQQTQAESLRKQDIIAYSQAKVSEVVRTLQEIAHHLRCIAKTKPYRLAHFFRRVERDVIKGSREERLRALGWLRRRLVGRQTPRQEAKNPLLDDAALILQARETLDAEILAFITAALQPTNDEQRHALAREQSLENRLADLDGALGATFPLTSIIIVTFNNRDLNRLCLQSLYAYTDWPNFEVIVVDNGSTDGTREYLAEAEREFSQLRVVYNAANLGFARANNIGLQQARGEYLVLLNNDTVVVQGWLSALIRHLAADRTIGLIGPVTNETGNEAKVPVGYRQLDEMPAWAREFTRAHHAYTFDIPMLTMFCVAMRRATFAEIGPLDEQFGLGMFEDDDYSLRMKMGGYRVVCAADAFVHHFGGASFKRRMDSDAYQRLFTENRQRYETKWKIGWTPHQRGVLKPAGGSHWTPAPSSTADWKPRGSNDRSRS